MTYICRNCGNTESFHAFRDYTEYGAEEIYMDGDGEVTEYGDRDSHDSDYGEITEVTCSQCRSGDIDDIEDDAELENLQREILASTEFRSQSRHSPEEEEAERRRQIIIQHMRGESGSSGTVGLSWQRRLS